MGGFGMDVDRRREPAPNIVWVNCDQLRWDAVGYAGNPVIRTPNIDRLAASGVRFDNAYCSSPVCSPARASWFTGLYPHAHRLYINYGPDRKGITGCFLPEDTVTVGDVLKSRGYACGTVGVWHLGGDESPQHGMTDYWCTFNYLPNASTDPFFSFLRDEGVSNPYAKGAEGVFRYGKEMPLGVLTDPRQQRTSWTIDRSIDFLDEAGAAPFFLMVGIKDPHPPMVPPQELVALYPLDELPFPNNFHDLLDGKPAYQSNIRCRIPPGSINEEDFRTVIRYYYALITHVDTEIGRLIEALERKGLLDSTIFVLNSDHGEMLGNHGFVEKCLMYEESVRVPCLISWPDRIPANQRVATPFAGVDMVPTLLDLVGAPMPAPIDGRSFARAIVESQVPEPRPIFAEIASDAAVYRGNRPPDHFAAHIMVLDGNWKYVRNRFDDDELYHLQDDPAEMINLAAVPGQAERVGDMKMLAADMVSGTGPGLYEWCQSL